MDNNSNFDEFVVNKDINQDLWESKVSDLLIEYINQLNLSNEYNRIAFNIYRDILNYIQSQGENFPFKNFLSNFRVYSPDYFALAFLYFALCKKSENFSQVDLSKSLDVKLNKLREVIPTFYKFLKRMSGYEFVYDIIRPQLLDENEYKAILKKNIEIYFKWLNDNKGSNFTNEDSNSVYSLFLNAIELISDNNKFSKFYDVLRIKSPRILAVSLWLVYIIYYKDIEIEQKVFVNLFNSSENLYINYGKFSSCYNQFISNFFKLDLKEYRAKIKKYLVQYIGEIEDWYLKNQSSQYNNIVNNLDTKFIDECLDLYDNIISSDFEIILIANSNEIYYYFPQTFALSLIFYELKYLEKLADIANIDNFEKFFGTDFNYRYIMENANRIYPFVRDILGRRKSQHYSKEDFLLILDKYFREFFHYETIFIYNLFYKTQFSPQDFAKEINYRSGRVFSLLDVAKDKINFTAPETYSKFRDFIIKYIPLSQQNDFLEQLEILRQLRHREFIHQHIQYDFNFFKNRIEIIDDTNLRNGLLSYFNDIFEGKLPDVFFNLKTNPRASFFYLRGISGESLNFQDIEEFLINKMINNNAMTKYDNNYYLCKYVQEVYNIYEEKYATIPHHNPILKYVLMTNNNFIAMEIPTWKTARKSNTIFTGHIDLLYVSRNTLCILDYKKDIQDLYRSIPQICMYGLMTRDYLNKTVNMTNINVKGIGFCKDCAIEFSPDILSTYILDFINYMNKLRDSPLLDKRGYDIKSIIEEFLD